MAYRRLGKFTINADVISERPSEAMAMLAGCLVVRAEQLWHRNAIEYVAMSDAFDEVELGVEPPSYVAQLTRTPDGATRHEKWVRQN